MTPPKQKAGSEFRVPGSGLPHRHPDRGIPEIAGAVQPALAERRGRAPALASPDARLAVWRWLGTVPYQQGLALQADLVAERRANKIPDQLLLLEHPHVITLGTSSRAKHILISDDERRLLDIERVETGRGGDVTYHGPGQLVGYPILDLKPDRCDLHRYVRDLEEVLIRALADLGIAAGRAADLTGVWVDGMKIAAIGVRVSSGWITSHGFALNVSTDLSFFDAIVPCGIRDHGVMSIERLLAEPMPIERVIPPLTERFSEIFDREIAPDQPTAGAGLNGSTGGGAHSLKS